MSKLLAVRLQEDLLARVDSERRRAGISRTAAIADALRLWVEKRQYEEAISRDQEAYEKRPVKRDEFASILGAQTWPK
jgi:metal-responsive CopG/Arc/MetJ family transcriptional regulator